MVLATTVVLPPLIALPGFWLVLVLVAAAAVGIVATLRWSREARREAAVEIFLFGAFACGLFHLLIVLTIPEASDALGNLGRALGSRSGRYAIGRRDYAAFLMGWSLVSQCGWLVLAGAILIAAGTRGVSWARPAPSAVCLVLCALAVGFVFASQLGAATAPVRTRLAALPPGVGPDEDPYSRVRSMPWVAWQVDADFLVGALLPALVLAAAVAWRRAVRDAADPAVGDRRVALAMLGLLVVSVASQRLAALVFSHAAVVSRHGPRLLNTDRELLFSALLSAWFPLAAAGFGLFVAWFAWFRLRRLAAG